MNDTVYDLFSKTALKYLKNTAIVDNSGNAITYGLFLENIEKYSVILHEEGVTKNDVVAIVLNPSYEFLTLVFACLKMGIPYIPIDMNYPDVYIENILQLSKAKIVVVDGVSSRKYKAACIHVDLSRFKASDSQFVTNTDLPSSLPEDIAYIIYTSGTTGVPKGVIIKNENITSLLKSAKNIINIDETDVVPLFHSISFDVSIWEIYYTLVNGSKLILVPHKIRSSIKLYCDFLIEHKVSVLNAIPSVLYLAQQVLCFDEYDDNSIKLRYVISAGEPLYPIKLKQWFSCGKFSDVSLYNMYGITEGTIHCTYKKIEEIDCRRSTSPIGISFPSVKTKVFDKNNNEVLEPFSVGELYLGGEQVTVGYLNEKRKNEENFFKLDSNNNCYFKTGDLVRVIDGNELEYIGRKGDILKVKGFRVNTKEVEKVLATCAGVKDASNLPPFPRTLKSINYAVISTCIG